MVYRTVSFLMIFADPDKVWRSHSTARSFVSHLYNPRTQC